LIITGRAIDAQGALRIGLANEVVPRGTSLERSFELARFICTLPQPPIRTDKEAAVRGFGLPLTASVNALRRSTVGQIFSKDYDSPDLSDPWLILHCGCVN
jgi:enoyl-CoA hydratase/carnithine racemase